jgi:hypothetical protein
LVLGGTTSYGFVRSVSASINSGTGFYADGTGSVFIGSGTGQSIKWDGSVLTINGIINVFGGNAATSSSVNFASLGGRPPNFLVMRKSTSNPGVPEATGRLQGLGYSVSESLSASETIAKGYDIVIIDCTQWSIGEYNTLIQNLLSSGSLVWTAGNDTTTDAFFVTSGSGALLGPGTAISSGSAHPVMSNWTSLQADTDAAQHIDSVQPWATPLGYYSEHPISIPVVEVSHPGGGVLIHGPRFGLVGTDADQYLRNTVNYLLSRKNTGRVGGLAQTNAQGFATAADSTLSGSIAGSMITSPIGKIKQPPAPSGQGLFLSSDNLGYFSGSAWQVFISSSGQFQFNGNASNFISWDGSIFAVKANQFVLSTTTITIDSTVSSGKIALGQATSSGSGNGVWADGTGKFRVGHPTGSYLLWDNNLLRISGSTAGYHLIVGSVDLSETLNIHPTKALQWWNGGGNIIPTSIVGDITNMVLTPGIALPNTNYSDISANGNLYKDTLVGQKAIIPGVIVSGSTPANPTRFHQGDMWLKV